VRGTVPPAGGLGAFQPAGAGYQAVKWSLWPFDVIVLTDALAVRRGSWRFRLRRLRTAFENPEY